MKWQIQMNTVLSTIDCFKQPKLHLEYNPAQHWITYKRVRSVRRPSSVGTVPFSWFLSKYLQVCQTIATNSFTSERRTKCALNNAQHERVKNTHAGCWRTRPHMKAWILKAYISSRVDPGERSPGLLTSASTLWGDPARWEGCLSNRFHSCSQKQR